MPKLKPLLLAAILAGASFALQAADYYDPAQSYPAGSEVSFNGNIYQAKWWANPSQSPIEVDTVAHAWETPWKLSKQGDSTTPPVQPEPEPNPDSGSDSEPAPLPPEDGYPLYSESESYMGGDIVYNTGEYFRCKTGVTVPWCSGASWAYEPGEGTAWVDAWEKVDIHGDLTSPDKTDPVEESDPVTTPTPPVSGSYTVAQADLDALENQLTDSATMNAVKASIATLDNALVEQVMPLSSGNPENVQRVERIIAEADWDYMFPKRTVEYTYRHFLQAVAKFPAFCGTYKDGRNSDAICRKSLATMFAHFTQETGGHTSHWNVPEWRQGLVHVREMGWTEEMRGGYNGECNPSVWQGQTWPCGTFSNGEYKSYFGRGAKQLSYNYNYGPFSDAMFGTVRTLLDKPEMVADTWLNLASAVFFFVYPQPPKPSMLHVIDGTWQPNQRDRDNGLTSGFGVTTQIINGGVECGGTVEVAQSLNRIDYYRNFANYLSVPVLDTEVLGCKGMKQFDADGAGALNIYWEKDWSWSSESPDGQAYACRLVGYQTPFSAFKERDFTHCVKKHFSDINIVE